MARVRNLQYNGGIVEQPVFNGVNLTKWIHNGVVVWENGGLFYDYFATHSIDGSDTSLYIDKDDNWTWEAPWNNQCCVQTYSEYPNFVFAWDMPHDYFTGDFALSEGDAPGWETTGPSRSLSTTFMIQDTGTVSGRNSFKIYDLSGQVLFTWTSSNQDNPVIVTPLTGNRVLMVYDNVDASSNATLKVYQFNADFSSYTTSNHTYNIDVGSYMFDMYMGLDIYIPGLPRHILIYDKIVDLQTFSVSGSVPDSLAIALFSFIPDNNGNPKSGSEQILVRNVSGSNHVLIRVTPNGNATTILSEPSPYLPGGSNDCFLSSYYSGYFNTGTNDNAFRAFVYLTGFQHYYGTGYGGDAAKIVVVYPNSIQITDLGMNVDDYLDQDITIPPYEKSHFTQSITVKRRQLLSNYYLWLRDDGTYINKDYYRYDPWTDRSTYDPDWYNYTEAMHNTMCTGAMVVDGKAVTSFDIYKAVVIDYTVSGGISNYTLVFYTGDGERSLRQGPPFFENHKYRYIKITKTLNYNTPDSGNLGD